MKMINLYQTRSEPFYSFSLVGHIADKDVYNNFNLQDRELIGQKPNPVPSQNYKLVSIKKTEHLQKWLYKTNTILQLSS